MDRGEPEDGDGTFRRLWETCGSSWALIHTLRARRGGRDARGPHATRERLLGRLSPIARLPPWWFHPRRGNAPRPRPQRRRGPQASCLPCVSGPMAASVPEGFLRRSQRSRSPQAVPSPRSGTIAPPMHATLRDKSCGTSSSLGNYDFDPRDSTRQGYLLLRRHRHCLPAVPIGRLCARPLVEDAHGTCSSEAGSRLGPRLR